MMVLGLGLVLFGHYSVAGTPVIEIEIKDHLFFPRND